MKIARLLPAAFLLAAASWAAPVDLIKNPTLETSKDGMASMPDSAMLKVKGNRLVDQTGKEIWLQGLAIPSMEWNPKGEHIKESFVKAVKDWNANCIRLPLKSAFWFGEGAKHYTQKDGGEAYRALVDELVGYATSNGCYVVLDLHEYKAPTPKHAAFWKEAAARYANHPGVLFDILNEPHGISWEEWRDGGKLAGEKRDGVVDENAEAKDRADASKILTTVPPRARGPCFGRGAETWAERRAVIGAPSSEAAGDQSWPEIMASR